MSHLIVRTILATGILACVAASAADGDLDTGFGVAGIAWSGVSNASYRVVPHMAVQADGRILVCAATGAGFDILDFVVTRFRADGTLDTGFGAGGHVVIDIDGDENGCAAIAVQPDGRILAAGWSRSPDRMALVRLTAAGALDASFGGGSGRVLLAFGDSTTASEATSLAMQSDGRILVAGSYRPASGGKQFAVARLLGDGSPDASFALTGRVCVDFDAGAAGDAVAMGVALDDNGRIVLGGYAQPGDNKDFALARLLPNGQLDAAFGGGGRTTLSFDLGGGNGEVANAMLLRGDRIVLVGEAATIAMSDMAVARFLADGSPDPSFGIGGKTVVPFDLGSAGSDFAAAVVAQGNGKLLIAGAATIGVPDNRLVAAIARLETDGRLDEQFGNYGKAWLDDETTPIFSGVALQGTRIVATGLGYGDPGGAYDDFVARLHNDLVFADGFDE